MASFIGNVSQLAALALIFQNAAWANVGNVGGLQPSSAAGSVYVQLSTGTLTAASTQSTTEAAYTNYARQAVARSTGGWTSAGSSPTNMSNAAAVTFPACGVTGETETYFSVGTASSGTGSILWGGALTNSLAVSLGITPSFAIGALVLSLD